MSAPTPAPTPASPNQQTGYQRTLGLLVFWGAVMLLGFTLITKNPTAIQVIVFAITVLSLDYFLFGGGTFWRPLVVRGAALALVLSMLSFLLPPTYVNSIPSREVVGQKLVDRGIVGSAWDGAWTLAFGKSATPAAQNSNTQPDPQPTPKADFTFLFEKDDCVTLRLGKVRWEPINHSLKVQDPSGQWILEKRGDEPVKRYFDSGEKWTFCKGDPNETGVHFWGEVFTSR